MYSFDSLQFRYISHSDLDDIVRMLKKNSVCKYLFFGPNTAEETVDYFTPHIENIQRELAEGIRPANSIFVIRENGQYIGNCALLPVPYSTGNFTVSYTIDDIFWSRGYGTQACRFLIRFGFRELKARRLTGECMSGNTGSWKIMENSGFTLEGRQKEYWENETGFDDNLLFGLLNPSFVR